MKLTPEKIYELEHKIIKDQELWDVPGASAAMMATYIAGINDMATVIVDAMRNPTESECEENHHG